MILCMMRDEEKGRSDTNVVRDTRVIIDKRNITGLKIPRHSPLILLVNVVWKQDRSLASEEVMVVGSAVLRAQPVRLG